MPCQVTFPAASAFPTVNVNATSLHIVLDNPPAGTAIVATTCINHANASATSPTIDANGLGIMLPINVKGTFVVNITLQSLTAQAINVVEDCPAKTLLSTLTYISGYFYLQVV